LKKSVNHFGIQVDVIDEGKILEVRTCYVSTTLNPTDKNHSLVMEVETPSGYKFDYETLKFLAKFKKGNLQSIYLQNADSKVTLYFQVVPYKTSCVDLRLIRFVVIGNLFSGSVFAYDFLDNSRKAQVFYDVPDSPDICDVCHNESIPVCDLEICNKS